MDKTPCRVHVVVDPGYGERIRGLPTGEPVWIVDSPVNHPVIQSIWQEQRRLLARSTDISSFRFNPELGPEDWLIRVLSTVGLHHGEFSRDPPYSILNVIGVQWSERIQGEISELGFGSHEMTPEGFVATRSPD